MCIASISVSPPKDSDPDLLTDPFFQPPNSHQHTEPHSQAPVSSPSPLPSASRTPPSPVKLEIPKLEPPLVSPVGFQSGSKLASTFSPQGLYLLWEIADGNGGITGVHAPFSKGDLEICKERFGRFSKNPDKFRDESNRLGLTFSLTWEDIIVILVHCGTPEGKESIMRKGTRKWPTGHQSPPPNYRASDNATSDHDPCWTLKIM